MELMNAEKFPKTEDFLKEVNAQFGNGVEMIHLATNSKICGVIVSPAVAKETLARRIADRWVEDPSVIAELAERVNELPQAWD